MTPAPQTTIRGGLVAIGCFYVKGGGRSPPARILPTMATEDAATEILYVCVHNAGRSQMAAAFTRALGGDRVTVRSAGSEPADRVNPLVLRAMAEVGIDLAHETPTLLADDAVRAADAVVTMGCGDACPFYPGKRYEDWAVPDPAEARTVDEVRPIRDEIRRRVADLLARLQAT
jgi:protein-tyrosine-phosphatase